MDPMSWIRMMMDPTPIPKTQAPMNIPKHAAQGKKKKGGKKK